MTMSNHRSGYNGMFERLIYAILWKFGAILWVNLCYVRFGSIWDLNVEEQNVYLRGTVKYIKIFIRSHFVNIHTHTRAHTRARVR